MISAAVVLLVAASTLIVASPASADTLAFGDWDYYLDGSNALVSGYHGTDTDLMIPSDLDGHPVTEIFDQAFASSAFGSVTIPNTVTTIGLAAFQYSAITSVHFGTSVTTINDWAFDSSGLSSLMIPDSVTTIGFAAFADTGITSAILGTGVTDIGEAAFAGNGLLTSVTIGDSVKTIGDRAFGDSGLTSVIIPASVTSIGSGAFAGAKTLSTVLFKGNAPLASPANTTTGSFGAAGVAVHYASGATGFTNPWKGYTASVAAASPTVSGVSPITGPAAGGTAVTITGTALTGVTAVNFGTAAATNVVVTSPSQVTATAPAGTGTVHVTVTTPSGTSPTSAADQFTFVTAAANSFQIYVKTAAGTSYTVTVTGDELISDIKGALLLLTSVPVSSQKLIFAGKTLLDSSTLAFFNIQKESTLHLAVIIAAATPVISSLSPTSGDTAGGTSITIVGVGFTGATSVLFGTAAAVVTSLTDTSIAVTAPTGLPGATRVTVTTPAGTSGPSSFTFIAPVPVPTLSGLAPSAGPIAGGTQVTVTGTGFTDSSSVSIGGTPATNVVVTSPTSLTVTVPAHSAGPVTVAVTTAGGTSTQAPTFAYAAAPTVTSVSPKSGSTLGGTTATISGTNFTDASTVLFGGTFATGVTYDRAANRLTAVVPAGTAGVADVTVADVGGTSVIQLNDQFTYLQFPFVLPPTVTSISPSLGTSVGGTTVSVTGTGFSGSSTVTFGAVAGLNVQVVDSAHLTVVSPSTAAGAVDVTVTTLGGTSATSTSDTFTFVMVLVHPATGADSPTLAAAIGTAYTAYRFTATGSPAPTFTLASGQLPPGLGLDQTSGVLSGIPYGAGGTYTFSIESSNGQGTPADGAEHTITVSAPPQWTADNPDSSAIVGIPYTAYSFHATGYPAPSFTTADALPSGMTLTPQGVLSGTPTGTGGSFSFTVLAKNGVPLNVLGTSHTIVLSAAPIFTSAAPPHAVLGEPYSYTFVATGYSTPTYTLSGKLPAGLRMSNAGSVTGTPTDAGSGSFTITASNGVSPDATTASQTIAVDSPSNPSIGLELGFVVGSQIGDADLTATAKGLLVGSTWLLQVFSTPQTLGGATVGPTGSVIFPFKLPTNLPGGVHHLLLTGTSAAGQAMSAVAWFTVSSTGQILAISTTSSTPTLGELARTGGNIDIVRNVLLGALVLLLGAVLVWRRLFRSLRARNSLRK